MVRLQTTSGSGHSGKKQIRIPAFTTATKNETVNILPGSGSTNLNETIGREKGERDPYQKKVFIENTTSIPLLFRL